jgi:hypothetical protein
MTMLNGLDSTDLDIMDEEFFGPPPRFLVEGHPASYDTETKSERFESRERFSGLAKFRQLMANVW